MFSCSFLYGLGFHLASGSSFGRQATARLGLAGDDYWFFGVWSFWLGGIRFVESGWRGDLPDLAGFDISNCFGVAGSVCAENS